MHHQVKLSGIIRTTVELVRGAAVAATVAILGCGEGQVPRPEVRWVAFGDSSTAGPADRNYPDFLVDLLAVEANTMANAGSGGENADEGLERLQSLISRGIYPNAHTLLYWQGGGDVVDFIREVDPLLLLSPDDPNYPFGAELAATLDTTQAEIESAIQAGHQAGWTVYVATYYLRPETFLPCEPLAIQIMLPGQARFANAYTARLNERIRQAAANQGAILIDVASLSDELRADVSNYFDCNHLSEQGNERVAELFAAVISPNSAEP